MSRIARVCKEDTGLLYDVEYFKSANRIWKTFVKSRIYCENKVTDPTFGEQTFTYNRVGTFIVHCSLLNINYVNCSQYFIYHNNLLYVAIFSYNHIQFNR